MYLPEIPESDARGRLRLQYQQIKATMHVPIVNYVFRALAFYPAFLQYALEVSRPNLLSLSYERAADELRACALPDAPPLHLPASITRRDLRGAANILPVFHYVNPKLLLLTTAWYEALSERPLQGHPVEDAFIPPGVSLHFPKQLPLVHIDRAAPPIRHLLKSIIDTHRSFGPASDYRALAHYPTFLSGCWEQIHPLVHTAWYQEHRHRLLAHAQTLVHTLPHPLPLSPHRLQYILSGREVTSCLGIIYLFQQMLPNLILDIELMTRLLATRTTS